MNPLMHIFRERELSFMLKHGEAKVLVVPKVYRNFDHEQMLRRPSAEPAELRASSSSTAPVADSFEALLTARTGRRSRTPGRSSTGNRPGPDDITQLIYTSGTTGEPKGVMHSANTLMANIIPYAQRLNLGADDVVLMASPMAHQTGFMYGLMMPIMLKQSVVLQDVWEPARAADLIRAERVTFTMASTPFLTDLTRTVTESGNPVPTLKTFLCAGAPIPGPLVEQAQVGPRRQDRVGLGHD
jgi:cyclohexanecarboxylate-CoA ligase